MENFIKEAKNGFYFDKTDSSTFLENHARMMISLLTYNIVNFMRTLCLSAKEATLQIDTLRLHLFKVEGKLVRSIRRLLLKLSTTHVFQDSFYQLLENTTTLLVSIQMCFKNSFISGSSCGQNQVIPYHSAHRFTYFNFFHPLMNKTVNQLGWTDEKNNFYR